MKGHNMKDNKDKTERLRERKQITCKRMAGQKEVFHKEPLRQKHSGVMLQNAEGKIST